MLTRCGWRLATAGLLLVPPAVRAQDASGAPPRVEQAPCDSLRRAWRGAPALAAAVQDGIDARGGRVVRWSDAQTRRLGLWIEPRRPSIRLLPTRSPDDGWNPGLATPAAGAADWAAAILRAARQWTRALPAVRFEPVADSVAADVHVHWRPRARAAARLGSRRGSGGRVAEAQTALVIDTVAATIVVAELFLSEHDATQQVIDPDGVHVLAVHEFGHALGLLHRDAASSVMAPSVSTPRLSAEDVAVARAWYALPVGGRCALR